jgi:hypothetical protein
MPTNNILTTLQAARAKGEKHLAVLVDPDKLSGRALEELVAQSTEARGVCLFRGRKSADAGSDGQLPENDPSA